MSARIRPTALRWPDWIDRCLKQGAGALAALAAEPWQARKDLDQAEITTACMLRYVQLADSSLVLPGRFPTLDALSSRCEALPPFRATYPREYILPGTN